MALFLPSKFQQDIQGRNTNLVPIVVIETAIRSDFPEHNINLSTVSMSMRHIRYHNFSTSYNDPLPFLPLLLNVPSVKESIDFYFANKDKFIEIQNNYGVGNDQTPINYLLDINKIDLKLLSYKFNMQDMFLKEILDDDLTFTKVGWVYHYNAIPDNDGADRTLHWMKKTYEHFYGELND